MDVQTEARAKALYTARQNIYAKWMSFFRHEQGISALLEYSGLLRPDLRILDAGCGSGAATFALLAALRRQRLGYRRIDAFDVTRAMLDRFRARLDHQRVRGVHVREADVLALDTQLPASWTNYALIVCTSMLEYVPRVELPRAVSALRQRLAPDGSIIAVITAKNPVSKSVIEWPWNAQGYRTMELEEVFKGAGYRRLAFGRFPVGYFWMNITNHVIIAGG